MTNEEIRRITDGINESLRPYVEQLVQNEVRAIPHLIRKEFFNFVSEEVYTVVKEKLREQLQVTVTLKTEKP